MTPLDRILIAVAEVIVIPLTRLMIGMGRSSRRFVDVMNAMEERATGNARHRVQLIYVLVTFRVVRIPWTLLSYSLTILSGLAAYALYTAVRVVKARNANHPIFTASSRRIRNSRLGTFFGGIAGGAACIIFLGEEGYLLAVAAACLGFAALADAWLVTLRHARRDYGDNAYELTEVIALIEKETGKGGGHGGRRWTRLYPEGGAADLRIPDGKPAGVGVQQ